MDELTFSHFAILGICVDINKGKKAIHQIVNEINSFVTPTKISNLYKRDSQEHIHPKKTELICALKISTNLVLKDLSEALNNLKNKYNDCFVYLLVFDKEINIIPGLTIPNPILVSDSVLLRCAAEVWDNYEHPILGQSLNEIRDSIRVNDKVEFYSQGISIF